MAGYLRELRAADELVPHTGRALSFGEFSDLIGLGVQLQLADRYAAKDDRRHAQ